MLVNDTFAQRPSILPDLNFTFYPIPDFDDAGKACKYAATKPAFCASLRPASSAARCPACSGAKEPPSATTHSGRRDPLCFAAPATRLALCFAMGTRSETIREGRRRAR